MAVCVLFVVVLLFFGIGTASAQSNPLLDCYANSASCDLCVANNSCVYCTDVSIISGGESIARSPTCVHGNFWGPVERCFEIPGLNGCLSCNDWRYGQCEAGYKVIYGLVFGLGAGVILIFLIIMLYFAFRMFNRYDSYAIVS